MRGLGPGSTDTFRPSFHEALKHNVANDLLSSSNDLDCKAWADIPWVMPLPCSGILEGTPSLESTSSGVVAISRTTALLSAAHSPEAGFPGNFKTTAEDQPCSTTLIPAHGSPAGDKPPPHPSAPDAPALSFKLPSLGEAQFTQLHSAGNLQGAAANCVQAGGVASQVQGPARLAVTAEPPNAPLQQALLPRVPPAPKAAKLRRGFAQRNRAKVALNGANHTELLAQKAALERELVTLLNRHERLSRGLPWHMQHEEVSFMASIARCVAAGRPGALPTRVEPVLEPSQNLVQKLMLDPCATMNDVYQAAGLGSPFPAGFEPPLDADYLDGVAEEAATKGANWGSIVTFLKLSKPQKEKLATAYDAHVQRAAAVRKECIAIGTTLQADSVLKPNLATHLACGHLTGIAKEEKDLIHTLNKECYEVLDQVQLNNLLALAPVGSAAALGLCREVATAHGAAATNTAVAPTGAGTPLTDCHQYYWNVAGDVPNPADVTADIIADVTTLANKDGGAAKELKNARTMQATGTGNRAGMLAWVMAAGTPLSKRSKRQTAESSWDSEGRPASKAQSIAAVFDAPTPLSLPSLPNPSTGQ